MTQKKSSAEEKKDSPIPQRYIAPKRTWRVTLAGALRQGEYMDVEATGVYVANDGALAIVGDEGDVQDIIAPGYWLRAQRTG